MTPSAGSSMQGPAQCARVSPPPGLVDPAAAGVGYTMWDDPDLAARLEAEENMRAVMVVAQQNEMVDKVIRSEDATTSGVPAALLAFVPNGAEAEHYGGLATLRTETKTPVNAHEQPSEFGRCWSSTGRLWRPEQVEGVCELPLQDHAREL